MLRAERPGQIGLVGPTRDRHDDEAHLGGELYGQVAEPPHADHRDHAARPRAAAGQSVEGGDAGAQHGRRIHAGQVVGDQRQGVGVDDHCLGVAAVPRDAVDGHFAAAHEPAAPALIAAAAVAGEPAGADALAQAPACDVLA